ncbi:MAG: DUF1343 domain-containing protein, partial [bacterium]|nr:DUF1343 domain-containing protein [bacterium]
MQKSKNILLTSSLLIIILTLNMITCGISIKGIGNKSEEKPAELSVMPEKVKLGVDVFIEKYRGLVEGKKVGLITNPSGVNRDMVPTVEVLNNDFAVNLTALFGPEHGIRGNIEGGATIGNYVDEQTQLPVYSLYGATKKPTREMLANVDVLIFDIQDIGVRPYTYMYTMAYAMEAAKEFGKEFIVLDRPNPLSGMTVDGIVLEPEHKSFIGLYPIPYVHGMTIGELAWLFNIEFGIGADLKVIPMEGWTRSMPFEETGLKWIPTSPHIPHAETVPYYATTGLAGELGTISVGVGYTLPFRLTGNPDINPDWLADNLNARNLPGITFRPSYWTQFYGIFPNKQLGGVQLHITDISTYMPFETCVNIMEALNTSFPDIDFFPDRKAAGFARAAGTGSLYIKLRAGVPADVIIQSYQEALTKFKEMRSKYLL